jgi:hypothetical protein
MIYTMYWSGMQGNLYRPRTLSDAVINGSKDYKAHYRWYLPFSIDKVYSYKDLVRDSILGNDKDTHVFIVTNDQHTGFKEWIKKEKLKDYIFYQSPKALVNENYPGSEPRLWLYVLCGPNNINRKEK